MRYLVLAVVLIGDLTLALAIGYLLMTNPSLLTVALSLAAVHAWRSQGGPIAWNKKRRRSFLQNAAKVGL